MNTKAIDKILPLLKKIPDEKLSSLMDYLVFLTTYNLKNSENIIEKEKKPNKTTLKAFKDSEKDNGVVVCKDADDMFNKLGI